MPETALRGVGVVITRPAHQAEALRRGIEAEGGRAICFPVLEILDPEDFSALDALVARLDEFDIAIFISPNAVNKALNRILAVRPLPSGLTIAAVGKGSARELAIFGLKADIVPRERFDSEALLELPAMQQVAGRRIVIFRGDGGRELLAETLKRRGAEVEYAEVYRRAKPTADVGRLMRHWARGEIDIVTVTSNEGLRNLFDMVGQLGREWLRKTPLVVASHRQVDLARELGVKAEPLVAAGAADEAIIDAVRAWNAPRRLTPMGNPT